MGAKQVVVTRNPLDLLGGGFENGSNAKHLLTLQSYPFPDKHRASRIGEGQPSHLRYLQQRSGWSETRRVHGDCKRKAHRKMEISLSSGFIIIG